MLFALLLSLSLLKSAGDGHEIYLSVLEINTGQMKVKVFTDNLQDAIRNDAQVLSSPDAATFLANHTAAIEAYFQKKIKLQIDERTVPFSLKEATLEGDSYWITFDLHPVNDWKSLYLEASYLMELFPDQKNIVKVMLERPQFYTLTKNQPSCRLTF